MNKRYISFINLFLIGAHNIYFHNKSVLTFRAENIMSFENDDFI